jgi:hypothetical protein
MAHLVVVGTHSTNGVAEIHSDLLRRRVLKAASLRGSNCAPHMLPRSTVTPTTLLPRGPVSDRLPAIKLEVRP